MEENYVWDNIKPTHGEVRMVIAQHRQQAAKLEQAAKQARDRADELERIITPRTTTCTGGRV